jgi:hypothetical protein
MACSCTKVEPFSLYKVFYNLARFFNERILRFFLWKTGLSVIPPLFIKFNILKVYKKKFQLHILVETGTYLGDTVNKARGLFKEIYSIEVDKTLYNKAKNKFSCYKDINILEGDSSRVLPEILGKLSQPALFWLDAHYSGGITSGEADNCPVYKEVELILSAADYNHVLLIDDAHLFKGAGGYPTLDKLEELIKKHKSSWVLKVEDNIIRIHKSNT